MRRIQLAYQTKFGLLFISPAALYFAGFWVLPVALAVVASATDWRIGRPAHCIGLSNYAGLVSDPQFHHALLASLTMTAIAFASSVALALGWAMALNALGLPLSRFY